jgi:hypothetical protein
MTSIVMKYRMTAPMIEWRREEIMMAPVIQWRMEEIMMAPVIMTAPEP